MGLGKSGPHGAMTVSRPSVSGLHTSPSHTSLPQLLGDRSPSVPDVKVHAGPNPFQPKSMPVIAEVQVDQHKSFDQAYKAFKRQVINSKMLQRSRIREFH